MLNPKHYRGSIPVSSAERGRGLLRVPTWAGRTRKHAILHAYLGCKDSQGAVHLKREE